MYAVRCAFWCLLIGVHGLFPAEAWSGPAHEMGCGDLVVDPGEECDDGNKVGCDGCDSAGHTGDAGACTISACGNRVLCVTSTDPNRFQGHCGGAASLAALQDCAITAATCAVCESFEVADNLDLDCAAAAAAAAPGGSCPP